MRKSFLLYLAVLLVLATFPAPDSMAQSGLTGADIPNVPSFKGKIAEVTISGNRRTRSSLIELNIETRQGAQYSPQTVKEDLKRIYKLDFF